MSIMNLLPQSVAAGLMSRRNIFVPTGCVLLLLLVWTLRVPQPLSQWVEQHNSGNVDSMAKQWPPKATSKPNQPVEIPNISDGNDRNDNGAKSDTIPSGPASGMDPPNAGGIDLSKADAPFIGWPLKRVCDEAERVEGLVFICDNNSGGIGNVRNYIHTCIRYALEAGATGLVVPKIRKRNETNLEDLFTSYLPFSYMFDEQHFKTIFKENCPHITMYQEPTDIPHAIPQGTTLPKIEEITPKDYGSRKGCDWKDQNRHTDRFGRAFRAWLREPKHGQSPSKKTPRLIRFTWGVLWDWPVYRDGPEFFATFGGILRFNKDILALGKRAAAKMREFAKAHGMTNGDYMGIHLRTEEDILSFWPTYTKQAPAYISRAGDRNFTAGYLATGNATEARKFEQEALEKSGMKVVTKLQLLNDADLKMLNDLTWDQQGLVDFTVLLESKYFTGSMPSSFSVYMAMKRHLKTGGLYTRPYKTGTEGDGLSYLVGSYEQYWDQWLFMWDGMWP